MRISDWSSDVCSSDLVELCCILCLCRFTCPRFRGRACPRRAAARADAAPSGERDDRLAGGGRPDGFGNRPLCLQSVRGRRERAPPGRRRSEEHTSELQSLMRISYAVFCLKKKKNTITTHQHQLSRTLTLYNKQST